MMICGIILSVISVFFALVPFISVYFILAEILINASNISNIDSDYLILWAIRGVAGMVLGYFFMYIGGMIGHIAAFRTLYNIRVKLSEKIGLLPIGFFNKNSTGKIKKIIEVDVEKIELFIAHQLPDLVNTIAMITIIFVVMIVLNVWYALACIVPIIIGFFAQYSMMSGKKARAGLKEYFDALEDINTSSIQYIKGMPSIKVFGQTVHSFRKFYTDMTKYQKFCIKYTDNFQGVYVFFRVIVLSLATFILPVGLYFISGDPNNIAFAITLVFFLVIAPGVSAPIFKLNGFAQTLNIIVEGVRRIDDILSEKTIEEPEHGKKPQSFDIKFKNVSFSYDSNGDIEVIKNINLRANQGEITALVGPSGSGKSTIAQLIPRFWDVKKGSITIGGVDIRDMKTDELMNDLSFVFQDTFLFSDTIYNNILIGKPTATREEVYKASKAAQCHEFIENLPNGYDTKIGDGGTYLSGGEEQRVSVARAILKNAPILILDEATAFADPENEYQMQMALQRLINNKTVLIIAHRLTTICDSNKIIVVNEGKIDDVGRHEELISHNGLYKKMWDAYTQSANWKINSIQNEEVLS
ncbi:ABC transporter ATP-binding protein [Clostridiaceae bacterium M8S5]|nr:ABC transporter ATP-binding protein [Clostridiaceae bacterium M8S5]